MLFYHRSAHSLLFYHRHPPIPSSSSSTILILLYHPHPPLPSSSSSTILILLYSPYLYLKVPVSSPYSSGSPSTKAALEHGGGSQMILLSFFPHLSTHHEVSSLHTYQPGPRSLRDFLLCLTHRTWLAGIVL